MDLSINDVVELARRQTQWTSSNRRSSCARELVDLITESRSNGLMAARSNIPALASDWPSSVSMSAKLRSSELKRRMCQFAISLQGANGARYVSSDAIDGGMWQRSY